MTSTARDDYPDLAVYGHPHGVPDRDAIAALDEIDRLRQWKAEATAVIDGWEAVWLAAGQPGPLGGLMSRNVAVEVERLRANQRTPEDVNGEFWNPHAVQVGDVYTINDSGNAFEVVQIDHQFAYVVNERATQRRILLCNLRSSNAAHGYSLRERGRGKHHPSCNHHRDPEHPEPGCTNLNPGGILPLEWPPSRPDLGVSDHDRGDDPTRPDDVDNRRVPDTESSGP